MSKFILYHEDGTVKRTIQGVGDFNIIPGPTPSLMLFTILEPKRPLELLTMKPGEYLEMMEVM